MAVLDGVIDTNRVYVGWKEVAETLGVTVQTAIRWRRELGLPVYKVGGGIRADEAALRAWERRNVNKC